MDFEPSDKVKRLQTKVRDFMDEHVYPAEKIFEEQLNAQPSRWQIPPIMEELKAKARTAGLWSVKPVRRRSPPPVRNRSWPRNPIDA